MLCDSYLDITRRSPDEVPYPAAIMDALKSVAALFEQMHNNISAIHSVIKNLTDTSHHDEKMSALEEQRQKYVEENKALHAKEDEEIARKRAEEDEKRRQEREGRHSEFHGKIDGEMNRLEEEAAQRHEEHQNALAELQAKRKVCVSSHSQVSR